MCMITLINNVSNFDKISSIVSRKCLKPNQRKAARENNCNKKCIIDYKNQWLQKSERFRLWDRRITTVRSINATKMGKSDEK